jgi:hypothetical protein
MYVGSVKKEARMATKSHQTLKVTIGVCRSSEIEIISSTVEYQTLLICLFVKKNLQVNIDSSHFSYHAFDVQQVLQAERRLNSAELSLNHDKY